MNSAPQTVYCEECLEEISGEEVYWEDDRIYCRRCGSELEVEDQDIFEEIITNRTSLLFRDDEPDDGHDEEEEEEEDSEDKGEKKEGSD